MNSPFSFLQLKLAMDAHPFQFGDENNGDVKLQLFCSDGVGYEGNPVYLHSQVLKKSKYFEARLSERWSSNMSPSPEIKLTVAPNGAAKIYIKCIHLMYSSYSGKGIFFSGVNETLEILPVASELLFEECIQACMQYLEAVPWTFEEKLRIRAQLSCLQVSISADLHARLGIPESSLNEELELLKKRLPEMFSKIWKIESLTGCQCSMRNTIQEKLIENFQGNASPAMREICKEALLNECRIKIEGIKYGSSSTTRKSACLGLLWFLDLIKLCNREIFEDAFKFFVEDSKLAKILVNPSTDYSFSCMLDILVGRYLKALSNGDIITPKSFRITFLRRWVPVMVYLILEMGYWDGSYIAYSKGFVEGVAKVVGTIPFDDQKSILMFFGDFSQNFDTWKKETFQWWMDVIWLEITSVNSSSIGLSDGL